MNGIVVDVSTSNFKVLDVEIMSRKACAPKDDFRKSNKIEFDKWKILHEPSCKANHEGSAGSMEVGGALRIFQRSVEKYGARYINYYGDGDSKSYEVVKNVYPGVTVEKYECIGHYQKVLVIAFANFLPVLKVQVEKTKRYQKRMAISQRL